METPATTPEISTGPRVSVSALTTLLADKTRWRILAELVKGEPLPVKEIARRLSAKPGNISKHCAVLLGFGIVQQGFGNLYKIQPHFLVAGECAVDFGTVLIRLDHLD